MRKRLLEASIAVVVEESVRTLLPPLLPWVWLAILALLTWEALNAKRVKGVVVSLYLRSGVKSRMFGYVIAMVGGAGMMALYWYGIGKAFAAVGHGRPDDLHQIAVDIADIKATVHKPAGQETAGIKDQISIAVERHGKAAPPKPQHAKLPAEQQAAPKPLPVRQLSYTAEATNSDTAAAPYAVKVVIQTTVVIQPVSLVVECSTAPVKATMRMAGTSAYRDRGDGYDGSKSNYWFFFGDPPFRPETPIIVTVMADTPIEVKNVRFGPAPPGH